MSKIPFLDRLTGAITPDDYDDLFESDSVNSKNKSDDELNVHQYDDDDDSAPENGEEKAWPQDEPELGELAVDVYQTDDEIVLKALVAGVTPSNLDISLTRDMVVITGNREEHKEAEDDSFYFQELYWGSFTRTVLLPEEIDVDSSAASENHGILIIRMPKVNKERKTKLKVKSR